LKAAGLYEKAWREHLSFAAFRLGQMYEQATVPDYGRAWSWYSQGAAAGEPNSLARLAGRDEKLALSADSGDEYHVRLLTAFGEYTRAVRIAQAADWPDGMWKTWRLRRATLARVLARDGLMRQVAEQYRAAGASIPEIGVR